MAASCITPSSEREVIDIHVLIRGSPWLGSILSISSVHFCKDGKRGEAKGWAGAVEAFEAITTAIMVVCHEGGEASVCCKVGGGGYVCAVVPQSGERRVRRGETLSKALGPNKTQSVTYILEANRDLSPRRAT